MLAELDVLLAHPLAATALVTLGALSGIAIEKLDRRWSRTGRFRRGWDARPTGAVARPVQADAGARATDQLRMVMAADFAARPLLNRSEARVFAELDRLVIARNPRWQVMAQVCVGEFVSSPDREAFGCVNSKRVDLLLMDEGCRARHALEYQGTGHHQGSAAARDAVKKEALRKAGIGYHEIVAGHTTPSELRRLVEKLVPAEGLS